MKVFGLMETKLKDGKLFYIMQWHFKDEKLSTTLTFMKLAGF